MKVFIILIILVIISSNTINTFLFFPRLYSPILLWTSFKLFEYSIKAFGSLRCFRPMRWWYFILYGFLTYKKSYQHLGIPTKINTMSPSQRFCSTLLDWIHFSRSGLFWSSPIQYAHLHTARWYYQSVTKNLSLSLHILELWFFITFYCFSECIYLFFFKKKKHSCNWKKWWNLTKLWC